MSLAIQDPTWPYSTYLLEAILEASDGASGGAAVYAFASAGGVKLLLGDATFHRFLMRARFDLIIGVDAVTNIAALDLLEGVVLEHPNLNVRVFLDEESHGLFHPKVCWFRRRNSSRVLVGSGNLTVGGLRGNCEIYGSLKVEGEDRRRFEASWLAWITFHTPRLFLTNNNRVRDRALANAGIEVPHGQRARQILVEDQNGRISVAPSDRDTNAVLIAEIPRSGNRWNQANFDLNNFQTFFGARVGRTQRIILSHVRSNGQVGHEEVRPSVAVPSQNYRFELDAASGLRYPRVGRPIAVFLRTATRTFRYHLLMPGSRDYGAVEHYLVQHSQSPHNQVRRLPTDVGELVRNGFPLRTLDLLRAR